MIIASSSYPLLGSLSKHDGNGKNKLIVLQVSYDKGNRFTLDEWENSDLQIEVRGRLRVRVLSSEHAHFENFRPTNLNQERLTFEIAGH